MAECYTILHHSALPGRLDAIFRDLKDQERKSGKKFSSYPARRATRAVAPRRGAGEGKA